VAKLGDELLNCYMREVRISALKFSTLKYSSREKLQKIKLKTKRNAVFVYKIIFENKFDGIQILTFFYCWLCIC
jgi:hypothetical protein